MQVEGNFDLRDLIQAVCERTDQGINNVDESVDAALNIIKAQVAIRGYVELHGFGSFKLRTLQAESGTDPQGNEYSVPERVTVEFNPFKAFRDVLTAETNKPAIL